MKIMLSIFLLLQFLISQKTLSILNIEQIHVKNYYQQLNKDSVLKKYKNTIYNEDFKNYFNPTDKSFKSLPFKFWIEIKNHQNNLDSLNSVNALVKYKISNPLDTNGINYISLINEALFVKQFDLKHILKSLRHLEVQYQSYINLGPVNRMLSRYQYKNKMHVQNYNILLKEHLRIFNLLDKKLFGKEIGYFSYYHLNGILRKENLTELYFALSRNMINNYENIRMPSFYKNELIIQILDGFSEFSYNFNLQV